MIENLLCCRNYISPRKFLFQRQPPERAEVVGERRETQEACFDLAHLNENVQDTVALRLSSIPEVSPERTKDALAHLRGAIAKIEGALGKNAAGGALMEKYHLVAMNPLSYLPQMVKESRLDPELSGGGYFQVSDAVAEDMEKVFSLELDMDDPVENCMLGILYMHWIRYGFLGRKPFQKVSDEDKELLSYAVFNMGTGTVEKLWEALKPQSFDDFEAKLSEKMTKTKGENMEVFDDSYRVNYRESPVVTDYMQKVAEAAWKSESVIDRSDQVTIGKARLYRMKPAVTLRYVRLIEGIRNVISCGPHQKKVTVVGTETFHYPNNTFWAIAKKLAYQLAEEPLFEDFFAQNDIRHASTIMAFADVLIAFNRERNPVFSAIDNDASNIPKGFSGDVWIPNDEYIVMRLKEEPDIVFPLAPPKASEKLPTANGPHYIDSALNSADKLSEVLVAAEKPAMKYPVRKVREDQLGRYRVHKILKKEYREVRRGNKKIRVVSSVEFQGENIRHLGKNKPKYVILHSTVDSTPDYTVKFNVAHYVVDRNGNIFMVSDEGARVAHAGFSMWNGEDDLNRMSIGIEVVAPSPQEGNPHWTEAQYRSLQKLLRWICPRYGIPKRNILTHQQVAYSTDRDNGRRLRGRKPDPYYVDWAKLGLPDNYRLVDPDVKAGRVAANLDSIRFEMGQKEVTRGKGKKQWKEESGWWDKGDGKKKSTLVGLEFAAR